VHTCNPSTQEAEVGGQSFRPVEVYSETLSRKGGRKRGKEEQRGEEKGEKRGIKWSFVLVSLGGVARGTKREAILA
jgi:predicted transposase YdaD